MSPIRKRIFRLPWRSARQIGDDVDEELRFHLDMRIDALVALGASADVARRQALREFGDLDDARSYIGAVDRDIEAAQRRSDIMSDLVSDIGYAIRKLRAAPAYTLAAVITLALGIGANTAMFSVVNRVLLRPLPFPQPDRLVRIVFTQQGQPDISTPMDLVDYRTQAPSFVGFSMVEATTANVVRPGADAERVQGVRVGANWFDLLRAKPLVGRFFLSGEDARGAQNVVVLSEQLWRRDFRGDPNVVGQTVQINAAPYTIVGVASTAQRYPVTAELWMPKIFAPDELTDDARGARWLGMLGRVKDGVDPERADVEVERISERMEERFPNVFRDRRAHIATVQNFLTGDLRKPLFIMLGAVAFVLLIACANVANLMLVRATAREGEMAIRTALGAGRGRLVRQLMTESVILSLAGAVVGVIVARAGLRALITRVPPGIPLVSGVSIDLATLALTAIVAVLTGLAFGVLPAMQIRGADLATTLRAGARGARSRPSAHATKRVIVVAEVSLAVVLLTGAGLLLHSLAKLLSVDPGFRAEGVLSMKINLPDSRYDSTGVRNFVRAVEERAHALPGVSSVALANFIPLDGATYNFDFTIRGRPPMRKGDEPSTEVRQVTPEFFTALGMPILAGRTVSAADRPETTPVLVVNNAFAKRFFPHEPAVGQSIMLGWGRAPGGDLRQIVGVVGDVHGASLSDDPVPTVYAPLDQKPYESLSILVRTNRAPATLAAPLRALVHELDRDIPVFSVLTMEERISGSVGQQRFYAMLIGVFAAIALALSAVGLYGVIAYAVSQRAHELGIRVALGATTDRISRMVIGEGLLLAVLGMAIGIVGSIFAAKLIAARLFGVGALDPLTIAGVVSLLAIVAVLASWLPAHRAARADPLVAMRGE